MSKPKAVCDRKLLTNVIVDERLRGRTLERVSDYIRSAEKVTFRCLNCEFVWLAAPHSVLNGAGCPECAKRSRSAHFRLPDDVVYTRLMAHGFRLRSDYRNTASRVELECFEGHRWVSILDNVLRGSGCPSCAHYGFSKSRPAVFYVLQVSGTRPFCGFGITCDYDTRIMSHANRLRQRNLTISKAESFKMSGTDASLFERFVKQTYPILDTGVPCFRTEAVSSDLFDDLLGMCTAFVSEDCTL